MGGFRKAMPFTFALLHHRRPRAVGDPAVLGLLLQGRHPARRPASAAAGTGRCTSLGYIGALLTGDLHVPDDLPRLPRRARRRGARARSTATSHHAEVPTQPRQRRGGGHRRRLPRARARDRRARAADEGRDGPCSRCGAIGAGLIQIPEVDYVIDNFLRPSFATSPLYEPHTKNGLLIFGLVLGTVIGLPGSRSPTASGSCKPRDRRGAARARPRRCTSCSVNKWYFDEAIDIARRAPGRRGRRASPSDTFERVRVDDTIDRRHDRARPRAARPPCAPPRAASCATTPRCSCSA